MSKSSLLEKISRTAVTCYDKLREYSRYPSGIVSEHLMEEVEELRSDISFVKAHIPALGEELDGLLDGILKDD